MADGRITPRFSPAPFLMLLDGRDFSSKPGAVSICGGAARLTRWTPMWIEPLMDGVPGKRSLLIFTADRRVSRSVFFSIAR